MFNSCICIDADEIAEVYSAIQRKAKKEHCCDECGSIIKPGEVYELASGLWDKHWASYKTCKICLLIRNSLFSCGFQHGSMRDDIWDAYGIDYTKIPDEN